MSQMLNSTVALAAAVVAGNTASEGPDTALGSILRGVGGEAPRRMPIAGENTPLIDILRGTSNRARPRARQITPLTEHINQLNNMLSSGVLTTAENTINEDTVAASRRLNAYRMTMNDLMGNRLITGSMVNNQPAQDAFSILRQQISTFNRGFVADPTNLIQLPLNPGAAGMGAGVGGLLEQFQRVTAGVQGIDQIFNAHFQQNMQILQPMQAGNAAYSYGQGLTGATSRPGAIARQYNPSHVSPATLQRAGLPGRATDLTDLEQRNYNQFMETLNAHVPDFRHSLDPNQPGGTHLYERRMTIGGETKTQRFAQVMLGHGDTSRSVELPLTYQYTEGAGVGPRMPGAPTEHGYLASNYNGAPLGEMYFGDRAGTQMYSAPGTVMTIDNTALPDPVTGQYPTRSTTGIDAIFNPYSDANGRARGRLPELLQRVSEGEDLASILFTHSSEDLDVNNNLKIFESIDTNRAPEIALSRKASQVMVTAEDPARFNSADAFDNFERMVRPALEDQFGGAYPIAGPAQQQKNIFHDPYSLFTQARVGPSEMVHPSPQHPSLRRMGATRGRGVVRPRNYSPLARLPGRKLIQPYNVINPGSHRAMSSLGHLTSLHNFRSGALRDMIYDKGLRPVVTGAKFATPRGQRANPDLLVEGSIRLMNPFAETEAQVIKPGKRAYAELGTPDNPFEMNTKVERIVQHLESSGVMQSNNPAERQRIIADFVRSEGIEFEEGEFIGKTRDSTGQVIAERARSGSGAEGRLLLQDIVPDERGFNLSFGKELPIGAAKVEGNVKATQMLNWSTNTTDSPVLSQLARRRREEIARVRAAGGAPDVVAAGIDSARNAYTQEAERWMGSTTRQASIREQARNFASMYMNPGAVSPTLSPIQEKYFDRFYDKAIHYAEGGQIYKGGNRNAITGQQQVALAEFGQINLDTALPELAAQADPEFSGALEDSMLHRGNLEKYTTSDANNLSHMLGVAAGNANIGGLADRDERQFVFGQIFGMEQEGTVGIHRLLDPTGDDLNNPDFMDSASRFRNSLRGMGYDDEMLEDLTKGIGSSLEVYGPMERIARDSSQESVNNAATEKRSLEGAAASIMREGEDDLKESHRTYLRSVAGGTEEIDPIYRESVERISLMQGRGPTDVDNVVDLNRGPNQAPGQAQAALNRIEREGGFFTHNNQNYFLPGVADTVGASVSETRGARAVQNVELQGLVSRALNLARSHINAAHDDVADELVNALKGVQQHMFQAQESIRTQQLEGPIQGSHYRMRFGTTPENLTLAHESPESLQDLFYNAGRNPAVDRSTLLTQAAAEGFDVDPTGNNLPSQAPAEAARRGQRVGIGKEQIDQIFDDYDSLAQSDEARDYLKKWRSAVHSRRADLPLLKSQAPHITEEAYTTYSAVYDPDMDKTGGVSFAQKGEWIENDASRNLNDATEIDAVPAVRKGTPNSGYIKFDPILVNKASADDDGDLVKSTMALANGEQNSRVFGQAGLSGREEIEILNQIRGLTSPRKVRAAAARHRRKRIRYGTYEETIGGALRRLATGTEGMPLDDVSRAFIANAGQAEIGLISSHIDMVRKTMQRAGARGVLSGDEMERANVFIGALEQSSVGFKHLDRSIGKTIYEEIAMIMSEKNAEEKARKIRRFFDTYSQPLERAMRQGQTMAMVSPMETVPEQAFLPSIIETTANPSIVTSAGTDLTANEAVAAMTGGDVASTHHATLAAMPEDSRTAYGAAAAHALPPDRVQGAVQAIEDTSMPEDHGFNSTPLSGSQDAAARRAGLNAAEIEAGAEAAGRSAPLPEAQRVANRLSNARTTTQTAQARVTRGLMDERRGIFQNRTARVLGLAGVAMAGAYAIFNKGYDDTPLSDIPPPPPSRNGLLGGGMTMQGVPAAAMGDAYNRDARDSAERASNVTYIDSNIPAPTSIGLKSYLDSSTARTSSRGLTMDRTTPGQYASAVRSSMPNSNVGLTINNNYRIPSDLEQRL